MSQQRLAGQVAVVTGASRGIGRACATTSADSSTATNDDWTWMRIVTGQG